MNAESGGSQNERNESPFFPYGCWGWIVLECLFQRIFQLHTVYMVTTLKEIMVFSDNTIENTEQENDRELHDC